MAFKLAIGCGIIGSLGYFGNLGTLNTFLSFPQSVYSFPGKIWCLSLSALFWQCPCAMCSVYSAFLVSCFEVSLLCLLCRLQHCKLTTRLDIHYKDFLYDLYFSDSFCHSNNINFLSSCTFSLLSFFALNLLWIFWLTVSAMDTIKPSSITSSTRSASCSGNQLDQWFCYWRAPSWTCTAEALISSSVLS